MSPTTPHLGRHHADDGIYTWQLIDIIETVYRGASKGRGLVVSPKGPFGFASLNIPLCTTPDPSLLRLFDSIQVLRDLSCWSAALCLYCYVLSPFPHFW